MHSVAKSLIIMISAPAYAALARSDGMPPVTLSSMILPLPTRTIQKPR
jgi:hypothetical protein